MVATERRRHGAPQRPRRGQRGSLCTLRPAPATRHSSVYRSRFSEATDSQCLVVEAKPYL